MLLKASDKSILVFYKVSHFIILIENLLNIHLKLVKYVSYRYQLDYPFLMFLLLFL